MDSFAEFGAVAFLQVESLNGKLLGAVLETCLPSLHGVGTVSPVQLGLVILTNKHKASLYYCIDTGQSSLELAVFIDRNESRLTLSKLIYHLDECLQLCM